MELPNRERACGFVACYYFWDGILKVVVRMESLDLQPHLFDRIATLVFRFFSPELLSLGVSGDHSAE